MACNCGKGGAAKNVAYVYTDSKGIQKKYPSRISAEAAKIRDGHKGSIREVPK